MLSRTADIWRKGIIPLESTPFSNNILNRKASVTVHVKIDHHEWLLFDELSVLTFLLVDDQRGNGGGV